MTALPADATDAASGDEPQDTPWLDAEQQRSWRSIIGGVTVLMDQLDRDLRTAHGLSIAEYEILVRLSEAENHSIRMAELAAAVAHSRSRITHTITRLERDGIVDRFACSSDGRGVTARLTDHGFSVLEAAAHTHVRGVHDYLVAAGSAEEYATVGRFLESVRTGLEGRRF